MSQYINVSMLKAYARLDELKRREEGQALVEYALILVLVSIVAVGILGSIGTNVAAKLSGVLTGL